MARPTIAAGIVDGAFDLAVSMGAPWKALGARSGIDPKHRDDPEARAPFERFVALLRTASDLCEEPAFGLRLGESCNDVDRSVTGMIARCSKTLGEAFSHMLRYDRLVGDAHRCTPVLRLALEQGDGDPWLCDRRAHPGGFPMVTEAGLARLVCASRRLFGERRIFGELHVVHAAPAHREAYERVFRMPVRFNSDCNGLRMSATSWMELATPAGSRFVMGSLGEKTRVLLESLGRAETAGGRVEALLIPVLHMGGVRALHVAAGLGMSRQSLSRRLKEEGTTVDRVVDDLRRRLALGYLDGLKVSVPQAAFLTGYADTLAFERAFARWTGTSPGQRRMAVRQQRSAKTRMRGSTKAPSASRR